MIRIRRSTPDDWAFFQEMEFETTWQSLSPREQAETTPEAVRAALETTHDLLLDREGNTLFVAETEEGERAGLLWLGVNRNVITGEQEAWIYNVSVRPGRRGQGVGRALLAHAEAHAREAGYRILGLMVATHNEGARRLYERLGFEETNVLMRRRLR